MRLWKGAFVVASLGLALSGVAHADKADELSSLAAKPWSLSDLPEFSRVLADVNETEGINDVCPGEPYTPGDVYHAAVTAGNHDWVNFSANAGDIITVGTDADGTPTVDTVINLYSSDCTTSLATDDDGGPGTFSLISGFVAPYTGTYSVRVRGFGATSAGLYRLVGSVVAPPDTECPITEYKGGEFIANVAIPDNSPAGITVGPISFGDDGSFIDDVVVDLAITHTWVGDLIVTLTHVAPGGATTSVDLLNRPGVPASTFGCGGNLVDNGTDKYYFGTGNLVILGEGSCPATIPAQCYAVAPENPAGLLPFRGLSKEGDWYLFVSDNGASDTGTLVSYSVHLLNDGSVGVEPASWGSVKSQYR